MNVSHRGYFLLALLTLVPACATYRAVELANEVADLRKHPPRETVRMNDFEKEPWKRGSSSNALNQDLVEYVRPPETVNDWTELLTLKVEWRTSKPYTYAGGQTFSEVPDPSVVMEATKRSAEARCGGAVVFRKLDEDRTGTYPSVIFYLASDKYPTASGSLAAEADVYRVFRGKHGLHTLIRARRAASLDEATLDEWTRYMKGFYLTDR